MNEFISKGKHYTGNSENVFYVSFAGGLLSACFAAFLVTPLDGEVPFYTLHTVNACERLSMSSTCASVVLQWWRRGCRHCARRPASGSTQAWRSASRARGARRARAPSSKAVSRECSWSRLCSRSLRWSTSWASPSGSSARVRDRYNECLRRRGDPRVKSTARQQLTAP